jgi:hypothetical protein
MFKISVPSRGGANMVSHRKAFAGGLLALSIVLALHGAAWGRNGRDFAGFYDLVNVTDLRDQVRFDLKLRVFNYSDANISNATLTLLDSLRPGTVYATFPDVSIARREGVKRTQSVTIPMSEYEQWQQGAQPNVIIWFRDAKNQIHEQQVELLRHPDIGRNL